MRAVAGLALALLACEGEPDHARYRRALVEAPDWQAAEEACGGIADPDLQGDCMVSTMERFNLLDAGSCAVVKAPVWRDECLFLLAERQWRAGELEVGLATCLGTRFRRMCNWHLLQDEVEATLDAPASEAEARLIAYQAVARMPDGPQQFWLIRLRERAAQGIPVDEADCEGLHDPAGCLDGVRVHVRAQLEALGKANLAALCRKEAGARVMNGKQPAWRRGPVAAEAEDRWVADRCPRSLEAP